MDPDAEPTSSTSYSTEQARSVAVTPALTETIDTEPNAEHEDVIQFPPVQQPKQGANPTKKDNSELDDPNEDDGLAKLLAGLGPEECYEILEVSDAGIRKLDSLPEKSPRPSHKRAFILRRKTTEQKAREAVVFTNAAPSGDRFDYEKKYPQDEEGKGMDPNARVWRVYLDESGQFDLDMVEGIKETVDVMLVSAGLFSAIVSTLVGQAYVALQQDFTKVTVSVLLELVEIQRAIASLGPVESIPRSSLSLDAPSTPSTSDRWLCGMWFTSLAISVSTALIAVLINQWIQAYVAPTFGTPQDQSRVRHFRYMGIEAWRVPLIVGLLPTLLNLSLFLFLAGLVVLLFSLDHTIATMVLFITILADSVHIVTLLPIWYPRCPYKTPLSTIAFVLIRSLTQAFKQFHHNIQRPLRSHSPPHPSEDTAMEDITSEDSGSEVLIPVKNHTFRDLETHAVQGEGDKLDALSFNWLCNISANPSVSSTVAHAISDLPIPFSATDLLRSGPCMEHICDELGSYNYLAYNSRLQDASTEDMTRYYVYVHAHLQLISTLSKEQAVIAQRKHDSCIRGAPHANPLIDTILEPRLDALRYLFLFPNLVITGHTPCKKPLPLGSVNDLASLAPPRTSPRVWISLLRISFREIPTFTLEILPPLTSLLRYSVSTPDAQPLEKILTAAYVFLATRIDTVPTAADHIFPEEALDDENRFFLSLREDKHRVTQRICLYYSHISMQLIMHVFRNPPGTNQLQYALDNLESFIDLPGLCPTPCEITNEEHPLFDLLPILLPNSAHFPPLMDGDTHTPPLKIQHRITQIKLCRLLFHLIDHLRIADTFLDNSSLQALLDTDKCLLALPETVSEPVQHCIGYCIYEYLMTVQLGCRSEEHLDYVFGHLVGICDFILSPNHTWVSQHTFMQEVVPWRPFNLAWDSLPEQLHALPSMTAEARKNLPGFLDELTLKLEEARAKLRAPQDNPKPTPSVPGDSRETPARDARIAVQPSAVGNAWHRLRVKTRAVLPLMRRQEQRNSDEQDGVDLSEARIVELGEV